MDPDLFQQLNRVIHEKGRLAIVSMLAATPNLSFSEMKEMLKMTDGNLTAHIRTLKAAEYVAVTKAISKRRSLTTYSLTQEGNLAFREYLKHMEAIVEQSRFPHLPTPSSQA